MVDTKNTKSELLYEMLQEAVIRGIGNCTQVSNYVAEFLINGEMPIVGWRNSFPGFRPDANISVSQAYALNEDILPETETESKQLLYLLESLLDEGQHLQLIGNMVGRTYETLNINHVFNAIKIDGEIRIIDCYQGLSSEPWLIQAWHEPDDFLSHFKNFTISKAKESNLEKMIGEYVERMSAKAVLDQSKNANLTSNSAGYFSFFKAATVTSEANEKEAVKEVDAVLEKYP